MNDKYITSMLKPSKDKVQEKSNYLTKEMLDEGLPEQFSAVREIPYNLAVNLTPTWIEVVDKDGIRGYFWYISMDTKGYEKLGKPVITPALEKYKKSIEESIENLEQQLLEQRVELIRIYRHENDF